MTNANDHYVRQLQESYGHNVLHMKKLMGALIQISEIVKTKPEDALDKIDGIIKSVKDYSPEDEIKVNEVMIEAVGNIGKH